MDPVAAKAALNHFRYSRIAESLVADLAELALGIEGTARVASSVVECPLAAGRRTRHFRAAGLALNASLANPGAKGNVVHWRFEAKCVKPFVAHITQEKAFVVTSIAANLATLAFCASDCKVCMCEWMN
jgi:hypothetical protein